MTSHSSRFQNHRFPDIKTNYVKLKEAIRLRDIKLVQDLIENGAPVNMFYSEIDHSPLHMAVITRCLEIVKAVLKGGASMGIPSYNQDTPLTLAAKMYDAAIIDLLLSYDVQNGEDAYQLSHLHVACLRDNVNVASKLLLAYQGRDVNKAVDHDSMFWAGYTPLHVAVEHGCIETVKLLLKCGADITAQDARKLTPLHLANLQRHEEIIDLILSVHKSELRNPSDSHGLSHFHIACTRDDITIVEHFLRSGVNINLKCELSHMEGWRPIHFAMYYECQNVITLLLESGVCLNSPLFRGLLEHISDSGNRVIHSMFLDERSQRMDKSKIKTYQKLSNFQLACINNNSEEVERSWLEDNTNTLLYLNTPIWTGCTPLHLAVRYGSDDVTKILLNCGADIMKQNSEGKTPLHTAFECYNQAIVEIMVESLIDNVENLADNVGLTLFHISCTTTKLDAVENFVCRGADINSQVAIQSLCWAGFTPLHFATRFRQPMIVKFLLEHGADILLNNFSRLNPFDLLTIDFRSLDCFTVEASDVLISILLSSSVVKIEKLGDRGISLLHALCLGKETWEYSDEDFRKFLSMLQSSEINRAIELPQSLLYNKCTPLHLAMKYKNGSIAKALLDHGANPLLLNSAGETPLEFSASFGTYWDISVDHYLKSLEPFAADPVGDCKPSHFHIACVLDVSKFVRTVLDNITDDKMKMKLLSFLDDTGKTPLHTVLLPDSEEYEDEIDMAQLLIKSGADVNAKDCALQTPLHFAAQNTHVDAVRILIKHGANVNAQNLYGQTPLHTILTHDRSELEDSNSGGLHGKRINAKKISVLLENGADVNIVDELNQTCLMISSRCSWNLADLTESITALLKHGKKLQIIGFYLSALNTRAFAKLFVRLRNSGGSFDVASFGVECTRELELMMTIYIDRYTTIHDILFKSPNEMSFYCENLNLQKMFGSEDILETYPIYGYLIRLQLKKGKKRRPLLRSSKKSLFNLIKQILPRECLEMILGYLDDNDLQNVISAGTL